MKKILSILLAILLLCSCANTEQPGIELNESLKEKTPPDVTIEYGNVSVKATKGNYSWEYDNGDGTRTAVEACGMHPLQFDNIAVISAGTEETAKLVFGEGFISCEIHRWRVEPDYLEKEYGGYEFGAVDEKVPCENGIFEVPSDGGMYVYALNVKYENGNAEYGFRIDPQDDWGITLSIKNVTKTGGTLVFTQNGGNPTGELNTGSYYRIECEGKEPDYIVEGDIGWTAEAYLIPKGGSFEMPVEWNWLYGELPSGTYKIYKQVMDFRGPGDYDEKEYFAEFTIGEKAVYSVSNMTIVDGAETGELVLAGEKAGDVMTVNIKDIPVYLDGEKADASVLEDGMTAEIRHDGTILEIYPARFSEVYEIHVYSLGTKNNPGGTYYDLCGLYLKVLDDLWKVDSGLNGGAEYVSIDLSAAPGGLSEGEKSAIVWIFGNKHGVESLNMTMEELKTEGWLTAAGGSNNLYQWDNGVLITVSEAEESETEVYSLPVIKFSAMKWRSPLGAYIFTDCSAVWPELGTWTDYTIGAHAIS